MVERVYRYWDMLVFPDDLLGVFVGVETVHEYQGYIYPVLPI